MKLFGWDVGWSRNIAIGCIWTTQNYGARNGFRSFAFLFLGLTVSRNFPIISKSAPVVELADTADSKSAA